MARLQPGQEYRSTGLEITMQRGKRLRALLMDNRGRLSIRRLEESPARLPALAHRAFVRTGVDLKRGLFVYEQDPPEPLLNLAATYLNNMAAREEWARGKVHKNG